MPFKVIQVHRGRYQSTRNSSGDETANVNFLYDYKEMPPPQTQQHGVVAVRTTKSTGSQASKHNGKVKLRTPILSAAEIKAKEVFSYV